jgi:hypothetical protein
MIDTSIKPASPQNIYTEFVNPGSKVPVADDIYILPVPFITCILEIAPKIKKSGVWWAFGGDLSEKLGGVAVIPKEIEILTNMEGVGKIFEGLAEYDPAPIAVVEKQLHRQADIDEKKYPVFVKSHRTSLNVKGVEVIVHGDYQIRVGEWDWGDSLQFKSSIVNMVGTEIPVMPIRLSSEIYLTLGWLDRAQMIATAISNAHHAIGQYGAEVGYDSEAS